MPFSSFSNVFWSIIQQSLNFRFVYFILFHLKCKCRQKNILKKAKKIMYNGTNCDRKPQLSGILTEPLNPRGTDSLEWEQ